MTHGAAVAYLFGLQRFGVKLGLDNIERLVTTLGAPHLAYPTVLITGSNGKGSVAAMMSAALAARGLEVGTYTSPHLVAAQERIAIGGVPITARRLARRITELRDVIDRNLADGTLGRHPTFFEVITAIAFVEFARRAVDVAVLEVGLGGRFDATNVAEPLVSVVTNITYEHTAYLGERLADIAREKAGVARAGRPLVIGARSREALRVLRREARDRGAEPVLAYRRLRVEIDRATRRGLDLTVTSPVATYPPIRLRLPGRHQKANAEVAIAALELLPDELRPSPRHIARGLAAARWPGRLEYVAGQPRLLLDGAHNPDAASNLAAHLREFEAKTRCVLLFSCLRDKQATEIIAPLAPLFEAIVLTRVESDRALPTGDLRRLLPGGDGLIEEPRLRTALRRAKSLAGRRGLVVVSGSLYLVGAVKALA